MTGGTDLGSVVRALGPRLYRLAARLTGSLDDAQDVVQEAFIRAHDSLGDQGFRPPESVEAWLRRVVVNAALDLLRSRGRRARREERAAGDEVLDPTATLEARAALRDLATWLDGLPPDQRTALVLKELEGHPAAEVARLMGCSEGAVEQRLVRARATLRARRSDHDDT